MVAPVLEYTYDLQADPSPMGEAVVGSRWTGKSISNHPDFVTILADDGDPHARSMNPEIDADWIGTHLRQ